MLSVNNWQSYLTNWQPTKRTKSSLQIPTLNSTIKLQPDDVIHTNGSTPVRVLCDNLDYYVVKYPIRRYDLVKEYLCAAFLQLWGLAIPSFAFVKISLEHIPMGLHPRIQPHFFQGTCFGLKYERYFDEVTKLMNALSESQKSLMAKKQEFLEIALFDLWLSNEDRNENNHNLLYDVLGGHRFIPIDHQATFNNGNPGKKLSLLTENESLIGTTLFEKLFTRKEVSKYVNDIGVKNKFYFCAHQCAQNLEDIVLEMPEDWKIDKVELVKNLHLTIFQASWLGSVWNSFVEYLQIETNPI